MPTIKKHTTCTRCIYDTSVSAIQFDENGVCNYCHMIDSIQEQYQTGKPQGEKKFKEIVEQIKKDGKNKKYDCVIGISGGTDSCYLVHLAVKLGLRPLAAHYDNTWNSGVASENIRKVLNKLNVDLYTHVTNNKEADDIIKSFFLAGVPELDGPTDLAFAEIHFRAAAKYNIKYVFEGHSYTTEGVAPLGSTYLDGQYIKSVHKQYGKLPMKTYPLMTLTRFLYWAIVKRIKKIRPLWYIDYSKEEARKILEKEYGWKYYGGHHLENRMSAFNHSVYFPQKFNIDQRNNSLSADVRSGRMSREDAIKQYKEPPVIEDELVSYFKKRIGVSDEEYDTIMKSPTRTYKDFKTYKRTFERLGFLFKFLSKLELVPYSFYIKYCSKKEL